MLSVFWLRLYIVVPPSNDIKIKQEGGMNREPLVTSSNWGKTPLHLIFQAAANVNRLMNWISTTFIILGSNHLLEKKNISESQIWWGGVWVKKVIVYFSTSRLEANIFVLFLFFCTCRLNLCVDSYSMFVEPNDNSFIQS